MNAPFRRRCLVRSLPLIAVLSTSACASSGPPSPQPWVPGLYDFESPLEGTAITGTIEVEAEGPASVTTSLGACAPDASQQYRPWSRSRTFLCAGDHRIVVAVGSRGGPPITGSVSNWRTVTRYEVVETCARYEYTETGGRACVEWREEQRTVTERVGGSARFRLVESSTGTEEGTPGV